MSISQNIDFNNPKEVQKELEKLLKERFGHKINILSNTQIKEDSEEAETTTPQVSPQKTDAWQHILKFEKTPKEIKAHLDKYIIAQDEAKKTLAIAICNHYNQIKYFHSLTQEQQNDYEYSKQNVLLMGPTGVGKTYMVRQIAKLVGVPFVKADATKYSETGYMGGNVDDLIKDLVHQAGDDITKAEHGIIYIDEADKLASSFSGSLGNKDISGRGVQLGLLKMLEDSEVDLRSGHDPASQMQALMDLQTSGGKIKQKIVNTRHILFILSGAFTDLDGIISKRLSSHNIGFSGSASSATTASAPTSHFAQVKTEDLVEYGYEPEFVGRLPVRVACHPLSVHHLFEILKTAHGSIINQFRRSFEAYNIEASFQDCALREVAKEAHKENTGARSLVTILDKALKNFIFELPSSPVRSLKITRELIQSPDRVLKNLIEDGKLHYLPLQEAVKDYESDFLSRHQIKLSIAKDAYHYVFHEVAMDASRVSKFLHERLKVFEYAIKIIAQNEHRDSITISKECLQKPSETFESWIKKSFAGKNTLKNDLGTS